MTGLKASGLLDRLKKGSLWSLLARVSGSFSALVVSMMLARLLSVDALGAYFLFLQTLTFAAWFVKVGMSGSLQKVLGIAAEREDWGTVRAYIRIAALLLVSASALLTLALYPSWNWFTTAFLKAPALTGFALLILLAVPLRALEELGSAFFCGIHEPRIGVFLMDVPRQSLLMLAFALLLLLVGQTTMDVALYCYFAASALSVLLTFALAGRWLRRHPVEDSSSPVIASSASFMALSFPMLIQSGAGLLMGSSDLWILGIFTSPGDVAIYGAVVRLATLMVFALNIVNLVIPPMLAVLHDKGDRAGLEHLLRTTAGWSVYVVVPVLLVFLVWGGDILALVFGEPFRAGANILAVLALAHSVNALSGSPGMLLQMTGHHHLLMRLTMFWAAFSVVANIAAVRSWGMEGVAVATGLSIVGMNLSMAFFARKRLKVSTWARLRAFSKRV